MNIVVETYIACYFVLYDIPLSENTRILLGENFLTVIKMGWFGSMIAHDINTIGSEGLQWMLAD